jgi:hypothetical protein
MALVTRVVWNEEGNGHSGKSDGNEGDGRATGMRAMARAMRLVGDKEGKGKVGKGNGNGDEGGR